MAAPFVTVLDYPFIGAVTEIFIKSNNDSCLYVTLAIQKILTASTTSVLTVCYYHGKIDTTEVVEYVFYYW